MAYTTPAHPTGATRLSASIPSGDNPDTHSIMHSRYLTTVTENPRAHGALGIGSGDDTAAFVKAINNVISRGPGGGGRLYIPGGQYIVDGDQILALLDAKEGWIIEGDGYLSTVIQAKEGSLCAFGVDGAVGFEFRGICFQGTGKGGGEDGFRMYGNSRSNSFYDCRFNAATNGFSILEDPGSPGADQNERMLYVNCHFDNSTVGAKINSGNAQEQLFIGGGSAGCDIGFHGSLGWGHFIGWFVSNAGGVGTGWKTDTGWHYTTLDNCLEEAMDISFDLQAGALTARNTFFQGISYTIKCSGAVTVETENCVFNNGDFNPGASSHWWSKRDSIAGLAGSTGTYTPNASAVRIEERVGHTFRYVGTTEVGHDTHGTGTTHWENVDGDQVSGDLAAFGGVGTTPGTNGIVEISDNSTSTIFTLTRAETDSGIDVLYRRARDSSADLQSGDIIARDFFLARNQSSYAFPTAYAVAVVSSVDAAPGATYVPGRLSFQTTAQSGSAGPIERMRIDSNGRALFLYEVEIDGALNHDGTTVGFYGVTPTTRPTALTTADASTVDGTYGAEEAAVIANLRTRVGELETKLQSLGLLT